MHEKQIKKLLSDKDLIDKIILHDGEIIDVSNVVYNMVMVLHGRAKPIVTAKINMTDDLGDIESLIQGNISVVNILSDIPKNKTELEKSLKKDIGDSFIGCRYERFDDKKKGN